MANFTAQYPWYILIRKSEATIRAVVKGVATLPIIIATRKLKQRLSVNYHIRISISLKISPKISDILIPKIQTLILEPL